MDENGKKPTLISSFKCAANCDNEFGITDGNTDGIKKFTS
jgi:hypothetical protein